MHDIQDCKKIYIKNILPVLKKAYFPSYIILFRIEGINFIAYFCNIKGEVASGKEKHALYEWHAALILIASPSSYFLTKHNKIHKQLSYVLETTK